MLPTRRTESLLLGSRKLIHQLKWVPRRSIWDKDARIRCGGRRAAGVASLVGTPAPRTVLLLGYDPNQILWHASAAMTLDR
jgi:hypothetical protein